MNAFEYYDYFYAYIVWVSKHCFLEYLLCPFEEWGEYCFAHVGSLVGPYVSVP